MNGRTLRRNLMMKVEGGAMPEPVDPPKRSIEHRIRHPKKKAFDYRVMMDDGVAYYVVSADIPPEKAAKRFRNLRPEADLVGTYERGFCRFNVVSMDYEFCDGGPGSFPVHIWMMEE